MAAFAVPAITLGHDTHTVCQHESAGLLIPRVRRQPRRGTIAGGNLAEQEVAALDTWLAAAAMDGRDDVCTLRFCAERCIAIVNKLAPELCADNATRRNSPAPTCERMSTTVAHDLYFGSSKGDQRRNVASTARSQRRNQLTAIQVQQRAVQQHPKCAATWSVPPGGCNVECTGWALRYPFQTTNCACGEGGKTTSFAAARRVSAATLPPSWPWMYPDVRSFSNSRVHLLELLHLDLFRSQEFELVAKTLLRLQPRSYLEWGAGKSTSWFPLLASRSIVVDNVPEWCAKVQKMPVVRCLVDAGVTRFFCGEAKGADGARIEATEAAWACTTMRRSHPAPRVVQVHGSSWASSAMR
jgi:hypothetical protein